MRRQAGAAPAASSPRRPNTLAIWICIAVFVTAVLLGGLFPGGGLGAAARGVQPLALLAFLLLDGSARFGWGGVVVFVVVIYLTVFVGEAVSIATGVPYGFFNHHLPGPKLLGVPPVVPLGYALYGYVAFRLAQMMTSDVLQGSAKVSVPVLAALILSGWDAVVDPTGSTLQGGWSYRYPGGLAGVPLSNFVGWIVTTYLAFQIFAALAARGVALRAARSRTAASRSISYAPPVLWAAAAAVSVFAWLHPQPGTVELAGRTFVRNDVLETGVIVALFAMGTPIVAAISAGFRSSPAPQRTPSPTL